ncbi:MAG: bifunctional riboflavin kinase/FAD synthetase [Gammaproteobacteria bacterium]|nr:bifunctional riboflavin kinase/FAD synthetase [Gammaproteobacteria bacterium]
MQLYRGLHNLGSFGTGGSALTIGNFDGVHRGHQALLERTVAAARALGVPATVMLFEPHPQEYFAGAKAPARLQTLVEKLSKLERQGVDRVLCLHFGAELAAMSAQAFIDELLVERLAVRHLVVGDDFRFGHKRGGDFALLEQASRRRGFVLEAAHSLCVAEQRVSSTRIREALACGDLGLAEAMLGEPYVIAGRVAHGDKRGRGIGFPTANIALKRGVCPVSGVYAVEVEGVEPELCYGVANIGHRPTVGGIKPRLEVHLFDFDGDLYGRRLRVRLKVPIRAERRFESFEALKAQIASDAAQARQIFNL